ncbi:cuticle protein 7-like [Adelges cooleyi]|uniref:cuticle protein 7-like n=1 Tax=Adelges cooleyi TaxID=133065 RepID=UPI00217FEC9A|nr:cuticle protein 7-like [Adelges cooleyi]
MRFIKAFLFMTASVGIVVADDLSNSKFAYSVSDSKTGDQKDQEETRSGNSVTGYYRTLDADGFVRIVNYKADEANGFVAEVKREPAAKAEAIPHSVQAVPRLNDVAPVIPRVASSPYSIQAVPNLHSAIPFVAKSAAAVSAPNAPPASAPYYNGFASYVPQQPAQSYYGPQVVYNYHGSSAQSAGSQATYSYINQWSN